MTPASSAQAPFQNKLLPLLLLLPQLLITVVFFYWPSVQAVQQSLYIEDPFGLNSEFAGLANFTELFRNSSYVDAFLRSLFFSAAVSGLSLGLSLLFAVCADRVVRGATGYKTLLLLPYAIAPALAGVTWMFVVHPSIGILGRALVAMGVEWNYLLNGNQAMALVIFAAAWKQISYNFIFFLAGLQSIPHSLMEAAAIDGAGPGKRFRDIVFPLLSPTAFFLLVVNIVYAFFETFGVIHAVTSGGPAKATEILVYKVYSDGVVGLDIGGSAAQSVILMLIVIVLTVVQFRFVERKVHY
ncbi:sn-glycerol-3-phosphate ABC transporter permease UgpA [Elstera cyanobacteriorum]|uniref:sn-glycerol-3-phosphate transport system permease protein UgpA n=1 Tax=Elstera cyanobacteriorum TaxID=2022747 RepID=A0A255XSP9_9PROT|nr:sn-glycerol-3-phosphate ABC transporter permease UgpA [Elstera cyanobacteriorum]MCK6441829.1 sn-glycerol-3-phosphate ABC transporter permease UgpA [Elstera cyanobacteriorum]OYQ19932.1 glycerol-3-phosphate transporter permease [Elstera cyanobacteriorum]